MQRAWIAVLVGAWLAGCGDSHEPTRDAAAQGDGVDGGLRLCSGIAGLACEEEGEFCWFPVECGAYDNFGICRRPPTACPTVEDPVCACNQRTYANECEANAAGESVWREGRCPIRCNHGHVRCRVEEPTCPEGQVASVEGDCWGPCVAIDECVCQRGWECPHSETYTCHLSRERCGPYL